MSTLISTNGGSNESTSFNGEKKKMPRKKKETVVVEEVVKKTKKVKQESKEQWPKIIQGSHSTRIEHQDGTVEFHTDWDALKRDVREAIREFEEKRNQQKS